MIVGDLASRTFWFNLREMLMRAIFSMCIVGLSLMNASAYAQNWPDILRDAQRTNQAALRQGRASYEILYNPPGPRKGDIRIHGEIKWVDHRSLLTYRIQDPTGVISVQPLPAGLEGSPLHFLCVNDSEKIAYNPANRIASITAIDNRDNELLNLTPEALWFRCCPPQGLNGRPWGQMVDVLPVLIGGKKQAVEYQRIGDNLVRQIRSDPDGSRMEVVYSLKAMGLPVSAKYSDSKGVLLNEGHWDWEERGTRIILKSCDFTRRRPAQKDFGEERYHIQTKEFDSRPIDPTIFDRAKVLALVAENTMLDDHLSGRSKTLRPTRSVSDSNIEELSDRLKSRGFASDTVRD